jgi:hypothetical protein
MSRKAVASAFGGYFLVTLTFGLLLEWAEPLASRQTTALWVDGALATAVSAFVIPGILPLAVWAFRRFRAERAAGPLFVWGVLGIAYMILSGMGTLWDQKNELSRSTANITSLSGSVRDTFVRSVNTGCIQNQKRRQASGLTGVTDAQIDAYCQCFADAMAQEVTAEEIMDLAKNGKPPDSFEAKADKIAPACSSVALKR